jgi:Icc-related predicted phosphoesterase
MKILAIGDPHGNEKVLKIKIPKDIDLILITGDLPKSELMRKFHFKYYIKKGIKNWKEKLTKKDLEKLFLEAYKSSLDIVKYFSSKKPTFFVFGNIYEIQSNYIKRAEKKYHLKIPRFEDQIKNLKNLKNIGLKTISFKSLKIVGIPYFTSKDWIKSFMPGEKGFIEKAKEQEPKTKKFIEKISKADIILSHIPPYGILDQVHNKIAPKSWQGKHAGSKLILNYIKKYQPKLVLCGHIHEAKGQAKIGKTQIYNLGLCGHKIIEI